MPVKRKSYAVIGTGALGGFYGAMLHRAGLDVHFLLHSDYEHVRAQGLDVRSDRHGDLSIERPNAYAHVKDLPVCDVVLVALKTTNNHLLTELLPSAAGPDSVVLMMQNGLGAEARAAEAVPDNAVLGGLAFLCSNKIGPGRIHHLDYGAVRIGEHTSDGSPGGITDRVRAVGTDFERTGLRVDLEEDLITARWKKLVWNMTYNGMCVVHECTTDVLMNDPALRAQCREIMEEVLAAAAGSGHPVEESFIDFMMNTTDDMAAYKPSMLLDFERGNSMELDAIYAAPLSVAREVGVECPRIRELYARLVEISAGRGG
jgi:2-dehydropantoate 2-reductase